MSIVLILKLVLVPSLIWVVTLVSRRWGPAVGGWLSAFPVVSAPILLFIALEHGAAFTISAAVGTLSAVVANVAFGIGYARGATRMSWVSSLAIGFVGYFSVVAFLSLWDLPLYLAAPLVLVVLLVAPRLYPSPAPTAHAPSDAANDVLWRVVAGAALVLLVTDLSAVLGPRLSGSLAMFPVMGSVLAVFSQRNSGSAYAIHLLRGMLPGYYSFGVFCILLSLTLAIAGIGEAFLMSLAGAALVQVIARVNLLRARERRVPVSSR